MSQFENPLTLEASGNRAIVAIRPDVVGIVDEWEANQKAKQEAGAV